MNIVGGLLQTIGVDGWCNGTESTEKTGFTTSFGYRYEITSTNLKKILGFSNATGNCLNSTEYGWMIDNTSLRWVEGATMGSNITLSVGDKISMECVGNTLIWKHNCNIVRQTEISRASRYHCDAQMYESQSILEDFYVWGMGTNLPRLANTEEAEEEYDDEEIAIEESIEITLYPNPSDGIFTLESNNAIDEVQVYNSNGSLIRSIQGVGDYSLQLNISDNPTGLYIVRIKAGNEYFTKKLLVK
jgi:hypothetical protein